MNQLITHLGRQVKKAGLLSIDLFDTLLTRTFAQPTDLFYALEKKLKSHLEEEGEKFIDFAKARIESEFQLRKEKEFKQEVILDEIYARLQSNMILSKAQALQAQKMELEMEEQSIIPIKQVIDIVKEFKKTLKLKVILVSDTYLPERFISKILKKNGLEGLCERLYLSSTHDVLKSTGSMFQFIKKKESIPVKKWLHIGDNKASDYIIPKRMGIKTVWFKEDILTRYERNYFYDPGYNHSRSTLAGLMKQARFKCPYKNENEKIIWKTTINVSAPFIIAYVHWCLVRAKALGLTRLYFMARDGQIMYKIANILNRTLHFSLELRYLYVSRQSLLFPAMKEIDKESLEWILAPTSIITPRIILNRINIEPKVIEHVLKKYGYNDADEKLERKDLHRFRSVLFESEVRNLIQSRIKIYRENTFGYLQQENLARDGKFALVDIGWNGTLQRSISRLLEMKGKDFAINGFYFGLQRRFKHKKSDRLETFFCSPEKFHEIKKESYIIPIIEMFTAADHGGVVKYKFENNKYTPGLINIENIHAVQWGVQIQQKAMEGLAEKMIQNNFEFSAIQDPIFKNIHLFITNPSSQEAEVYGLYMDAEDQNESYFLPLAKKYNFFELFRHFKSGYLHHHNEWKEAALKLSNGVISGCFVRFLNKKNLKYFIIKKIKLLLYKENKAMKEKKQNKVGTIIFLHLVKTAGTTLNQILEREYSNILSFYIPKESKELFENFKKKLKNEKAELIRGHFEFGWHIFLSQPFVYFTIFRDPIDRVLSEYYYILGKPDHPFYNEIAKKNVSLADFVKNWNAPNLQTRKISGITFSNNSGIPLLQNIEINDNNMLEIAKENLDKYFAVVGLTENFDETLILLKGEFGWVWPFYTRQNVTASKVPRENIPGATIEIIREYNQQDIELYEYARQIFYEKIRQHGESFFDEVGEFKKLNKVQKI